MSDGTRYEHVVDAEHEGIRLDVFLAACIEGASRSYLQKLVKDRHVTINGRVSKRPSRSVHEGETVAVDVPPPPSTELTPEDIPLEILHEDDDLVIVNKQSGLVVHPAPGHYTGTLVHALLHHCPDFQRSTGEADRPGIVHRLDRFTSGVMVVAKTPRAFASLAQQARDHSFDRQYLALTRGTFPEDTGVINASIGRSSVDRARMSITGVNSREAITRFRVLERLGIASLLALQLETGRTHQIRVHLRFTGHPVLGDPVYGDSDFSDWGIPDPVRNALAALEGQALHAERLGIEHPATSERMTFTAPPPTDFQAALDALRTMDG
ncbi:MAG: RluA family pseudouridine synthase [bacterium]|nr:RluA family pseudouridine synthase [bacterium]